MSPRNLFKLFTVRFQADWGGSQTKEDRARCWVGGVRVEGGGGGQGRERGHVTFVLFLYRAFGVSGHMKTAMGFGGGSDERGQHPHGGGAF